MHQGTFWAAFLWSVIPALILLIAIWWLDRYEKEPIRLILLALVFGAVLAPLAAYGLEKAFDITTSYSSQAVVLKSQLGVGTPLVEEIMRGLAILAVFLLVRWEIDDLLDGIVYGGIVGLGFGAAANFVSIWSTPHISGLSGGGTSSLYSSSVTMLNHVFYGALIGLALAAARRANLPVVLGAAAVGIGAAFLFHVLHDYLPWWVATSQDSPDSNTLRRVVTQIPNYLGIAALGLIALWSVGRERVLVGRQLRDEVDKGVVTPTDYANVTNSFRRSGALWTALLSRGQRAWRLRRQLYALETELAFRKYHREEGHTESVSREYVDEDVYRKQIRETRERLMQVDPAAKKESRTAAPSVPRNSLVAGLGGLALFSLLVAAGVLVWFLALRPSVEKPREVKGGGGIGTAYVPQAQPGSQLVLVQRKIAAAAAAQIVVAVCLDARCSSPKIGRVIAIPRRTRAIFLASAWRGLRSGSVLQFVLVDVATRHAVGNVKIKVPASGSAILGRLRGPFPRAQLGVLVGYNGVLVKSATTIIKFV